jgi:plastocyanin
VWAVALLALFGACGNPDETETAASQQVELEAYDFYFEETQFLFDLGARVNVELVNAGDNTHSFTADDLDIDVEVGSGESTNIEFEVPDEPGIFDFYCKYHPDDMKGTISVGGSDEPIQEDDDADNEDDADVDVDVDQQEDPGAGGGAGYDY